MRDLLESLDRIAEAPGDEKGAAPVKTITKSKPEDPRTVTNKKFGSISDFIQALRTPGQQGGSTAAQTKANLAKATAPVKAKDNEFDQKSTAAIKNTNAAPIPFANVRRTQTAMPGTTVAKRAKVKATAANTKDFDKTMALQKKLISMGADIKADGLMGPNTRAAMAKFMPAPSTTPNANTPYVPVTTGDKPQNNLKGIDRPLYQPLPNTFSQDKDGNYTRVDTPVQPNKPNTGPMYEPINKDSMSNLEKAKAYQKMVKAPDLTTPAVTPAVKSADDAIGKSGEKAVNTAKKTTKSLINRLKDLF